MADSEEKLLSGMQSIVQSVQELAISTENLVNSNKQLVESTKALVESMKKELDEVKVLKTAKSPVPTVLLGVILILLVANLGVIAYVTLLRPAPATADPCAAIECPEGEVCKDGTCTPVAGYKPEENVSEEEEFFALPGQENMTPPEM